MDINTVLTILNLLVAVTGVSLVLLAYNEFRYLNKLKKWKRKGHWWPSRTSNPVCGVKSLAGGFDSHALPPYRWK